MQEEEPNLDQLFFFSTKIWQPNFTLPDFFCHPKSLNQETTTNPAKQH